MDRLVSMLMPLGSASLMRGLMSSSATRSPLTEISICSPRVVLPYSCPVGMLWNIMRKVYSPSAGKMCTTRRAAARANRRARRRATAAPRCAALCRSRRWRRRGIAERVAADLGRRTQIPFEHRRRERLHVGDVVEAVADGVGRQQRRRRRRRCRAVPRSPRAYSARLRRWNGRRPGFGRSAAARSIRVSIDDANAVSVASSGRFAPAGGIMPARSLRIIFSATSGCCSIVGRVERRERKPPALPRSLWHVAQYCLTSCGLRLRSYSGSWSTVPDAVAMTGLSARQANGWPLERAALWRRRSCRWPPRLPAPLRERPGIARSRRFIRDPCRGAKSIALRLLTVRNRA